MTPEEAKVLTDKVATLQKNYDTLMNLFTNHQHKVFDKSKKLSIEALMNSSSGQITTEKFINLISNSTDGITLQSPFGPLTFFAGTAFMAEVAESVGFQYGNGGSNTGNFFIQPGGPISSSDTKGFLYIPKCSAAPLAAPDILGGNMVPIVFDETGNTLYAYSNGGWKSAVLT